MYWHTTRKGEAVLSPDATRGAGHPEGLSLQRRLKAALEDLDRLKQRNEARDRTMYAEGYNLGYLAGIDRTQSPGGRGHAARLRRQIYAHVFPRPEDETRGLARRRTRRAVSAGSVDAIPPPEPLTPSVEVERGADTSGQPAPGVPQES